MEQKTETNQKGVGIENEESKRIQDDELEGLAGGANGQQDTIICSVCHRRVSLAAYPAHISAHRDFR